MPWSEWTSTVFRLNQYNVIETSGLGKASDYHQRLIRGIESHGMTCKKKVGSHKERIHLLIESVLQSTLVYQIIVQDGINVQDGKIPKINKRAGWNKAVQVGIFHILLVKINV